MPCVFPSRLICAVLIATISFRDDSDAFWWTFICIPIVICCCCRVRCWLLVISLCIVRGLRFSLQDGRYVRQARGGRGARYAVRARRWKVCLTFHVCFVLSLKRKSSGFPASYQHGYFIFGSATWAMSSVISIWFTDCLARIYLSCDLLSIAFVTSPVIRSCVATGYRVFLLSYTPLIYTNVVNDSHKRGHKFSN